MAAQTSQPDHSEPRGAARFLPVLQWAPAYDRGWFRPDIIAGLTVAALVVPKSLGYAGIAGVPIQHGLYAAAAATPWTPARGPLAPLAVLPHRLPRLVKQ